MNNYFTIGELIKSDTAIKEGINNTPSKEIESNLLKVIDYINPLREEWGSPIRITSGYRCPELNKAVKGSTTSNHLKGLCADMQPINNKMEEFKRFCLEYTKDKPFNQLIIEKNSKGSEWVHLDISPTNKREAFTLNLI